MMKRHGVACALLPWHSVVSTGSNQLDLTGTQAKWSEATTYTTLLKQITCDTRDPVKQLVKYIK